MASRTRKGGASTKKKTTKTSTDTPTANSQAANASSPPTLDEGQLLQILTGLRVRVDAANAQLVQLGLLVEYLYERLEATESVDVKADVFPEWAKNRYEEIQAAAQEAMKGDLMDTFKEAQAEVEKEITLTE